MTDSELEPEPPLAAVPVQDTPAFWPLIAVEAWVLAHEPSEVDALCRSLPAVDNVATLLHCRFRSERTIQAVRRAIMA